MLRAEACTSTQPTEPLPHPIMESHTINLYVDADSPEASLLTFPLVFTSDDKGKKTLTPQFRIQFVDSDRESERDTVFITTYGFIQGLELKADESQAVEINHDRTVLTSCMLPIGSVAKQHNLQQIAQACLDLKITCKKTANNQERIVFTVVHAPQLLSSCSVVKNGVTSCAAAINVKSPEKISSNQDLDYKIVFVSLTIIPKNTVYKVPSLALKATSNHAYSVNLSAMIKIDIPETHPLAKTLTRKADGFYANVWIHFGLISAVDKSGKRMPIEKVAEKVRRLEIRLSLVDLFGPTIIFACKGIMTKTFKTFFSRKGTAAYPLGRAAPGLGKLLWSQSASIQSASIVLQGGTLEQISGFSDYAVDNTKITKEAKNSKYNPFKK
ncbi:M [Antarctic penguin virus C]|uniref:Matrix protein n=2 Tax=Avulavirinae TaxID=2560069 RepID=A0A1Y0KBX0_9MONO|nr:M [Antarctic penguin virus C] [Antarctic penguin virus C]ARU83020.1 M [Antarctic penguin virus C] [Antarctic penguin virus C]QBK47357.1 M [Avulavirus sp.] [Avulavirus sp.]QBK47363.1 M [Avulavirus sp.] [Avulavirus sp.]